MRTQTRLLVFLGLISLGDGLLFLAQKRPVGPPVGPGCQGSAQTGHYSWTGDRHRYWRGFEQDKSNAHVQ